MPLVVVHRQPKLLPSLSSLLALLVAVVLLLQRGDNALRSFAFRAGAPSSSGPRQPRRLLPAAAAGSQLGAVSCNGSSSSSSSSSTRRTWMSDAARWVAAATIAVGTTCAADPARGVSGAAAATAETSERGGQFDPNSDPEFADLYDDNKNPAMPPAPEERSGLVVLRVAEVAQFQEKILRAIVDGDLKGVTVAPMQFAFGTQILLRNSNLDGNMKLMIEQEIPKRNRPLAVKNAVNAMNTLQEIATYSSSIRRDFEPLEMVALADMYRTVRINLNQLYEYLPEKEQDKYYGYMVAVTEYEKKVANGTYNPDIDGVLKFDD